MNTNRNRVALVTGGTSGIGAAICVQLSAMGIKVATNCRNMEKAQKWRQEVRTQGHDIHIFQGDVRDQSACTNLLQDVHKQLGAPISILINNAGITRDARIVKMTKEQWDEVIDINLNGLFNITQGAIDGMIAQGWGRIINISSVNGQKGQFGQTNYAASKAGMHGFTMSLAQELANKGITVNTVSPGYIATEMVMAIAEEIRDKITAQIPVGRLGRPDEVAALVAYLCSENTGFVTGADFSINGGQHMM